MATEQIILDIRAQIGDAQKRIKSLEKGVKGVNKEVKQSDQLFQKAAGTMAALFSVAAIANFTRKIIEVRSEFEKYNAVLKNTLGSAEAANIEFEKIQKFASETPFSVRELTNAFVKLVNQGFKPSTDSLRRLGDLAASTGKSFDQLTEAIIDATVGEFERLKEFGIRAKKSGDTVKFTFKEVETQVKFTRSAIEDYILSLGDLQGVQGAMAEISETLGGKISNLGDNWDSLLDTLGGRTTGIFNAVIGGLNRFLKASELASKTVEQLREEVALMQKASEQEAALEEFLQFITIAKSEGETYTEVAERFLRVDEKRLETFDRLTTKNEQFRTVAIRAGTELTDVLTKEEELQRGLLISRIEAIMDFARREDMEEQARLNRRIEAEFKAAQKIAKTWNSAFDKQMADAERYIEGVIAGQEFLQERAIDSSSKILDIDDEVTQQKENNAIQIFRTSSAYAREGSFLQKSLSIADATISAYMTAQFAAESLAAIPVVGPALATAAYIAFLIAGLQTVAQIASVSFEEGGFTGKSKLPFRDKHGPIAGLVHEDEFVFSKEKTSQLRPLFEDIHSGRIDARGLAALTARGVIMPLIQNDFNSKILEREVGKIYGKMQEKEPERWIQKTDKGYIKKVGNTVYNVKS